MPISCPFCNAAVRVPAGIDKVDCPRCGETVAVPEGTPPDAAAAVNAGDPAAARPSNKAVGLTVAGVMVGLAALALGYALLTTDFRRSNDNKNRDAAKAPATAVLPGELAGLGYLPANVQAVAGVAVAHALEAESGRALFKSMPVTGFALEEIDHVVVAADLTVLPPSLTVVVRTRRPLDLAKVRAALKAGQSETRGGRTFYKGKLPVRDLDGYLTFPDERTLVAAPSAETLAATPATYGGAGEQLAVPVRDLIAQLPADAPAWLVGRKEANNATFALAAMTLTQLPVEFRQGLQQLSSLSLSAAERDGRFEVAARATGFNAQQAGAVTAAVRGIEVGRATADGVDPLTMTWSEPAADLVKRLAPSR